MCAEDHLFPLCLQCLAGAIGKSPGQGQGRWREQPHPAPRRGGQAWPLRETSAPLADDVGRAPPPPTQGSSCRPGWVPEEESAPQGHLVPLPLAAPSDQIRGAELPGAKRPAGQTPSGPRPLPAASRLPERSLRPQSGMSSWARVVVVLLWWLFCCCDCLRSMCKEERV